MKNHKRLSCECTWTLPLHFGGRSTLWRKQIFCFLSRQESNSRGEGAMEIPGPTRTFPDFHERRQEWDGWHAAALITKHGAAGNWEEDGEPKRWKKMDPHDTRILLFRWLRILGLPIQNAWDGPRCSGDILSTRTKSIRTHITKGVQEECTV